MLEIQKASPNRQKEDCSNAKRCGGCDMRHIEYSKTLEIKRKMVQNLIKKTLKQNVTVEETIGMEKPIHYRNKAQYPFGRDKENKPIVGIFAKRSHEIIPLQTCQIQSEISEQIAKTVIHFCQEEQLEIYNEKTRRRHFKASCSKNGIYFQRSYVYFRCM